uniref:8.9 kDa family member n=1 Tax=Rhipicephalus zambeziensis TaxID=60191 RepID=A0A224Y1B6_9ACAR
MIRCILFCGALHLILLFRNAPGQLVNTYDVDTDGDVCVHNGSEYKNGVNETPGFCGLIDCETANSKLTIVRCDSKPPPSPCVLLEPTGNEYPKCCPEYLC